MDPVTGSLLAGGVSTLLGGIFGSRDRSRDRQAQERQAEADRQVARETSGNRGWPIVDPLLQFGADEARRVYENRLNQGPYAQNVRRPGGQGASQGMQDIAGVAQQLATGGPGQAGQAGIDYASALLGGGGAPGSAATYFRNAGQMAQGMPTGRASQMYGQAYNTAAGGSNQYLDPIFGIASQMLGGGGAGGGGYGGGGGGGGGNAGRTSLNAHEFDVNADDPRFSVDAQGNLIAAPEALDSQGYVGQMLGENAPVGAAQSLADLIADPFARSNPQLENMIRLQQQDLERAHQADIGRLKQQASDVGAYGGSNMQLAQAQMAGELGRNVERASTGLRYQDYNDRLAEQMQALQLGAGMDTQALAQAAQMEIFNRQDLTDREKANLSAIVQRELSNQDTQRLLAQGNQSTGANIYMTEADLNNRAAIAGADRAASSSAANRSIQAQREAAALQALLGVGGLQNEQQLGRLGLMGDFAGGQAGLEQAGLAGMLDTAGGLGQMELGALGQIPGLEGIQMGRLGQAFDMAQGVRGANASGRQARRQWEQDALQWDYNREQQALNDLINSGLAIGSHIQYPTGVNPFGAQSSAPPGGSLAGMIGGQGMRWQPGDRV